MPARRDSSLRDPHGDRPEKTAYDRDALRDAYGDFYERVRTFEVDPEKYEAMARARTEDAIGGGRVLVHRKADALLVSNRGESGWDVPGGAREPGEAPEETARREVREEVGLQVELRDALQVNEFGFRPREGGGDRVSGLWVIFEGVPSGDGDDLSVQTAELEDARWFDAPPADVDDAAQYSIEGFFEDF